MISEDYSENNS